MSSTQRLALAVAFACFGVPVGAQAHGRAPLPATSADSLLDEGRWTEADAQFYQQSERAPRNPLLRAALGRYLAMKGAVRPAIVLIEEAHQFGLDSATTRLLLTPLRAILYWRSLGVDLTRDSAMIARPAQDAGALLQVSFPGGTASGIGHALGVRDTLWHDVVDRAIGLDSLNAASHAFGVEVFEAFAPSLTVRDHVLMLHANARSALSATGKRYQVLRSVREIRVLVGERRVLRLADALRELAPTWWQLDLAHGLLVVR